MNHNSNNPEVSVILPTYNRAHLIKRAIQSVLNQTYQNFEIIVVDDGSTDNTEEEVVRNLNNKKIRYIRHNENKGAASARNTGIKVARGEFIAFQDSDDEWSINKLERQMEVFKNAPLEVGVVYTGGWLIRDNERTHRPLFTTKQREGSIYKELFEWRITRLTTPATIVKKECFNRVGMFDERLSRFIDWDLWLRISKYYEFKYIAEPLVTQYYTPASISADLNVYIEARKLILEKYAEEFKKNKKMLARYFFDIGYGLCSSGKTAEGIRYFLKSFKAYPLNLMPLPAILISLFGPTFYNKATELYREIKKEFITLVVRED
jgi:glycosyltransferase involved in cell wall biosynthesis